MDVADWEPPLAAALERGNVGAARRALDPHVTDRDHRSKILTWIADGTTQESDPAHRLIIDLVDEFGLARAAVSRVLIDERDIEDASQDTLIKVSRGVVGFDAAKSSFTTWLFTLGKHAATDHLRRQQQRPTPGDVGETQRLSSMIATQETVRELVRQLPPHFRAAVELREIQRMSYEEIAEALGLSVSTIRSQVHRGRAALGAMVGNRPT